MKFGRVPAGLFLALGLASGGTAAVGAATVAAAPTATESVVQSDLKQVTSLELPAKAAELVRRARGEDRETIALGIVRVVAKLNPSALPSVVASMTRVQPSLGSKLAAEATRLQPNLKARVQLASETPPAPNALPEPTPTQRNPIFNPNPGPPPPHPTPDEGKKKGHYKRPQGP